MEWHDRFTVDDRDRAKIIDWIDKWDGDDPSRVWMLVGRPRLITNGAIAPKWP
jgi:hypothetical protein